MKQSQKNNALVRFIVVSILFLAMNIPRASGDTIPQTKRILCFGDSLTAGLGLSLDEAYPALIQKRIEEEKLPYEVMNAGISGETTAGGVNRLNWVLREPVDVFILALGANDALRGLSIPAMKENLATIIERVQAKYPAVKFIFVGMLAPPNQGADYSREYEQAFRDVALTHEVSFIPFLLDGVAGKPELNQPDGLHPNKEGQEKIAQMLWKTIRPILSRSL